MNADLTLQDQVHLTTGLSLFENRRAFLERGVLAGPGQALELAVDGLMEYDRYLASHPELFIKATSVADVDEARAAGKMAVFYLYQMALPGRSKS